MTVIQGRNFGNYQAEPGNCVKVEVAALGSPSLIIIVIMVSVEVKQH